MSDPRHHGVPAVPAAFLLPTAFAPPTASRRLTVIPDVPLLPVRSLLAASLAADPIDRDVVWVELAAASDAEAWDAIRGALAAASGSVLSGDPVDAMTAHLAGLRRPLLLVVTLPAGVSQNVDARLLALLSAAPQLSIAAICTGRRALEGLGRIDHDAEVVAPSAMVHDSASIAAHVAAAGIDLSDGDAARLATSPLARPDMLGAVLATVSADLLTRHPDAPAVLIAEAQYLLGLQLRAATDATLEAALPLAVPESLTAAMLVHYAPGADERQLDLGAQAGILHREPGTDRFALEPALRSAVLDVLRERLPSEVRRVEAGLGEQLLATGDALGAARLLARAERWDEVIDAIDSAALDLIGEESGLHELILGLPRQVREAHPRLSLLLELEWDSTDSRTPAQIVTTRRASAALTRLPDVMSPWDRVHAALVRAIVFRLRGDYTTALAAADVLADLLENDDLADRPSRMLAEAHYQVGMTRLLGVDLVGARDSFARASALSRGLDGLPDRPVVRAAEATALVRALEGEAEQAASRLGDLQNGTLGTPGLVTRALIAIGKLDSRDARHWLSRLADLPGSDEFWVFALHAANRFGLYWGDPVETEAALDRTWAEHGEQLVAGSTAHVLLTSDAADLALLLGQLSRAEASLETCTVKNTWIAVTRARLALLSGNPKHALLFILEGQGRGRSERYGQLDLAVLRAAAELALGRLDDATASLLRAINQSEKSGVIVPFHLLPLETLAELGALHPDASAFVARHKLTGTSYLAPYQSVAGALSERELVVLRALDPGATIEQIAKKLFVASNTVKAQLRSIYRKLNVSTRTEALLVAAELGLLDGKDSRTA